MSVLGIIPSWAWRWVASAVIGVSLYGVGYLKGRAGEEVKFDAYKAEVKAAGDKQNELTQQIIGIYKQRKENADATAQDLARDRDAALARVRAAQLAAASRRIVPAAPVTAGLRGELCYSADELNRRVGESLARLRERVVAIAAAGQTAVDTATVCRNFVR